MTHTVRNDYEPPAFDASTDVVLNGVQVATGALAEQPLTVAQLCALAEGRPLPPAEQQALEARRHRAGRFLGVAHGVDENDLAQTGWGVVFAADDPHAEEHRRALEPLLALRREQAGPLYRELAGDHGLRPDETGFTFLARHGLGPGPVDVTLLPYYLLFVGEPAQLPFAAQTDVDSRHAVGRLALESADALHAYAERVVRRERAATASAPRAALFAPRNAGDVSTSRSARLLARPLADAFAARNATWTLDRLTAGQATRAALAETLNGGRAPSLLFAACHGARLDPPESGAVNAAAALRQRALQGALVTQEWPGPLQPAALGAEMLFAADDLDAQVALDGMVALLFACFGAGTPAVDEFLLPESGAPRRLADAPFVSRLPQRMLAQGAGAVIGHVERAWSCSFQWPGAGSQTMVFQSVLNALADGWRVGAAVAHLNSRYADVSLELSEALRKRRFGLQNDEAVAGLWTAQTDARNYVVLGDPAVRLGRAH